MINRILALAAAIGLLAVAAFPAAARNPNANNSYTVHNLVSDATDASLVNGWGITASSTSPWWVSDNGTDKSTLYDGSGVKQGLTVNVAGAPTGTVFNGSADFVVRSGTASGPARFLFATEEGTIRGWNPGVDSPNTEVGATTVGAIYKGLAIGHVGTANYLYAANFHDPGIDVFDGSFGHVTLAGNFVDPGLPAGYAPFGIQALNGMIFVTYAKQDADRRDEIAGAGLGYVSVFGMNGTFMGRVASRGALNAPWGLAWAPATGFGRFSGNLLVGNFGDGRINAYAWTGASWVARGHLKTANHHPLSIDGLWGIGFGHGPNSSSGPVNTLFFAAGPDDESHGLFGSITTP